MADIRVVCVGDELLRGETEERNSGWIARRLHERGVGPRRICVVPDEVGTITESLVGGFNVLTGGLGPTSDDVTRRAVAEGLGFPLEENGEALRYVRRVSTVPGHEDMAMLPRGAVVFENGVGVAPGFYAESGGVEVLALPGPPGEMRDVFERAMGYLEPEGGSTYSREVLVPGTEGELLPLLGEIEEGYGVKLGSYPEEGRVRVRVAGEEDEVDRVVDLLEEEA